MRTNIMRVWLGIFFLLATSTQLHAAGRDSAVNEKVIVATIYPLALFAKNLLRNVEDAVVRVELLTENAHGCLHDYVLKPSDIKKINNAALVLMNGGEMEEGALAELLAKLPSERRWNSDVVLPAIVKGKLADAHYFADPQLVPLLVSSMAERLTQLFPDKITVIGANLDDYLQRLNKLRQQVSTASSSVNVVVLAETIERTVRSFGFNVVPLFYESEFHQPSPRQVAEAPQKVQAEKVRLIFVEAGVESRYAVQLAKISSAKVVVIDPVIRGPAKESLTYYEDAMQSNLQRVKEYLSSHSE